MRALRDRTGGPKLEPQNHRTGDRNSPRLSPFLAVPRAVYSSVLQCPLAGEVVPRAVIRLPAWRARGVTVGARPKAKPAWHPG